MWRLQLTDLQARDSVSQSQIRGSCADVAGMRAPSHALSAAFGDPLLTMEVPRRYWRARPGIRGHVSPTNSTFTV
jgi:hypothetical protein